MDSTTATCRVIPFPGQRRRTSRRAESRNGSGAMLLVLALFLAVSIWQSVQVGRLADRANSARQSVATVTAQREVLLLSAGEEMEARLSVEKAA